MADEVQDEAYLAKKREERMERGKVKAEKILKERLDYKKSQAESLSLLSSPKARYQSSVRSFIDGKNAKYLGNPNQQYCKVCWFGSQACICQKLKRVNTRHHYLNWLHHKEVWRTTNTGCILPQSCDNSKTVIHGIPEDDDYLDQLFQTQPASTVILYPCPGSISLREFYEKQRTPEQGPISDWEEFLKTAPVLNIIGVDSTWSQSRAMGAAVPDTITRVHLTDPPQFSVSKMRNQGLSGRITTVEAFAAVMKELGENQEDIDALMYNLNVRMESLLQMGGTAVKNKSQMVGKVEQRLQREEANRQKKAEKRALREARAQHIASSSSNPIEAPTESRPPSETQS